MKQSLTLLLRGSALLLLVALEGCSTYSEKFDCVPGKGVGCLALHKVDTKVDEKTLPFQVEEENENASKEKSSLDDASKPHLLPNSAPLNLVERQEQIIRIPEQALKVWIAPYEDDRGQFHEASVVHMVVKAGQWVKR